MLQLAIGATASLAQNSAEPEASVQPVQMRAAARDIAPLPMETERTLDGMPPVALMRFAAGSAIFHADWIPAPNVSDGADGLGPLYNATSCNGCHGLDNKTATRTDEQDRGRNVSKARVIRFEDPDPVYGRQLQDHAIDGFLPEGRAVVTWKRRQVRLNDGTQVVLRQPITTISDVGYGALAEKTEIHLRRVPPIEGLGLIAAIAAADIAANADPDDRDHDGVSGRVGRSVDAHTGKPVLARFGWKASAVSLATQTEDAFALDMGLSSPDKPDKSGDCTLKQAACFSAPGGGSSAKAGNEVSADEIALVAAFLEGLAPPPAQLTCVELEHRAKNRNQFCLSSGWSSQKESDAVRGGVTDKSHDALGGRRSQTRRAERICANLGASRLARSAATRCDGPLDLATNTPRQNESDLSPDALARGCAQFTALGCPACHHPSFKTPMLPQTPHLSEKTVYLFSDLLLHDMGHNLADGGTANKAPVANAARTETFATKGEWRTAPLWGLGVRLKEIASGKIDGLMHDGRARTIGEAILWHGGEGAAARELYRALPAAARLELETFLGGL